MQHIAARQTMRTGHHHRSGRLQHQTMSHLSRALGTQTHPGSTVNRVINATMLRHKTTQQTRVRRIHNTVNLQTGNIPAPQVHSRIFTFRSSSIGETRQRRQLRLVLGERSSFQGEKLLPRFGRHTHRVEGANQRPQLVRVIRQSWQHLTGILRILLR